MKETAKQNAADVNRKVKDSVFTDLFKDKANILKMYKELHPEDAAVTVEDITPITLTHVIVNKIYNDLGFKVRNMLIILVEAQSTWSVNIIIRLLIYLIQTYQEYIHNNSLYMYSSKRMELPVPELYVIYTGDKKDVPHRISIRKDIFPYTYVPFDAEAEVITTREKGIIHEYIMFVKIYTEQCRVCETKAEAITETLRICKDEDILKEYLESRESEVYSMLDVLFDQQYQEEAMKKDSFREGKEEGRNEGLREGRSEGLREGRSEGLKEGRNEGLKEGRNEERTDALCRMINGGLTENFIVSLGYTKKEYSNALKKLAA